MSHVTKQCFPVSEEMKQDWFQHRLETLCIQHFMRQRPIAKETPESRSHWSRTLDLPHIAWMLLNVTKLQRYSLSSHLSGWACEHFDDKEVSVTWGMTVPLTQKTGQTKAEKLFIAVFVSKRVFVRGTRPRSLFVFIFFKDAALLLSGCSNGLCSSPFSSERLALPSQANPVERES